MSEWKTWGQGIITYLLLGSIVVGFVRGLQQRPVAFTDVALWVVVLPWEAGSFIHENMKANQQQVYPYR